MCWGWWKYCASSCFLQPLQPLYPYLHVQIYCMNHIWYFYLSIYLCNFASVFTKLDVIFHPSKIVSSILILFAKTTQTSLFEKVPIWASLNFVLHHKKLILYLSSQADFRCFPSFLWSSFKLKKCAILYSVLGIPTKVKQWELMYNNISNKRPHEYA